MIDRYLDLPRAFRSQSESKSYPRPHLVPTEPSPTGLEVLDRTLVEGTSPIDLSRLGLSSREQAFEFLKSYGYDLSDPIEAACLQAIHREAVDFLQRLLCPAPRPGDHSFALPLEVQDPGDLLNLLLWASASHQCMEPLQPWACAVLRVMHAITYANQMRISPHSDEIRRQILAPYRAHIFETEDGHFNLGQGDETVRLLSVQFREEKARDSLLLKLLHKPDNSPQSVYDRVGVRMVTATRHDALRALQYIRRHHLANPAHIMPGRSRNTLFDCELRSLPEAANPHSSPDFRSLQFTCQHLVKVDNPMHQLAAQLQGKVPQEALALLSAHGRESQIRFLFPYEVQILDSENDHKTRHGESSHAHYRLRQLRAVRARVFPLWLTAR